jgi:hypothetical protein
VKPGARFLFLTPLLRFEKATKLSTLSTAREITISFFILVSFIWVNYKNTIKEQALFETGVW